MGGRVRIVLQARTNSSRLPAKVLLPIGGMPLAIFCARRLGATSHEVVLATSDNRSDDLLSLTAERAGVKVFRGSLDNVLDRFVQCVGDLNDDDIVVRATADNPLPNGSFIDALIQASGGMESDYFGTSSPADGLPYGLSAEICLVGALRRVAEVTNDALDFEHVTTMLRRQAGPGGFICKGLLIDEDLSHLRATIDTLEDYLAMTSVFAGVDSPVAQDWKALIPRLPVDESVIGQTPLGQNNHNGFSSIMLGTAQFGSDYGVVNRTGRPSEAETEKILTLAIRSGVTHLDTARAYGDAESRVGRLIPVNAKAKVKIVTKLQPLDTLPDDAPEREVKTAIDASVYGSCRNLRREHLDVLMLHRSADMFRWQGATIRRLAELVREGVVDALGVSVYTPEEAIKCLSDRRITHLQIPFNLLDSRWLSGKFLNELAQHPNVCVHVRSVFLQGLLLNQAYAWPDWVDMRCKFTERIESLVRELGRKNSADLCMAYVRSFSWVTTLVLGVETLHQLEGLLALAAEPVLTQEQVCLVQGNFVDVPARLLNPSQW